MALLLDGDAVAVIDESAAMAIPAGEMGGFAFEGFDDGATRPLSRAGGRPFGRPSKSHAATA